MTIRASFLRSGKSMKSTVYGRHFSQLAIIQSILLVRHHVFLWEDGSGYLASSEAARIQGQTAWDELGVAVRQIRELPATLNLGSPWDMKLRDNCS